MPKFYIETAKDENQEPEKVIHCSIADFDYFRGLLLKQRTITLHNLAKANSSKKADIIKKSILLIDSYLLEFEK